MTCGEPNGLNWVETGGFGPIVQRKMQRRTAMQRCATDSILRDALPASNTDGGHLTRWAGHGERLPEWHQALEVDIGAVPDVRAGHSHGYIARQAIPDIPHGRKQPRSIRERHCSCDKHAGDDNHDTDAARRPSFAHD
jgi:hypothetical protein